MLVIVSDLHLTDGTGGATISPNAFAIFADQVRDLSQAASWRADGSYRPIERVDVVLLGDVLDIIRSARWNAHDTVRPWSNQGQAEFASLVTEITHDVLRHNEPALAVLRKLAGERPPTLPAASQAGRPAGDAAAQPIEVKLHYLVGNHDWFFHLRGPRFNQLRQTVVRQMGLANRADEPFPHDPAENEELLGVMRRHRVFARHGDIFDPFNFTGDRDASSLGDAIVIELLNRFALAVDRDLASELPAATLAGLRELDNVRPTLLVPVWLDGLLERTCPLPSQRRRVKAVWDDLAEQFLELPYVRQQDTWRPDDLVDGLQRTLKFSRNVSLRAASAVLGWLNELRGANHDSYYQHALAEQDFRNRRAKHIVYGHTHDAESVPLDASYAEGYVLNQVYFNSGTWRRVHRQTRFAPREHEFIPADVMTYLAFFQGDERGGRSFESWTGTLGIEPVDMPQLRVDQGKERHAEGQSVPPSALQGHAPHFGTAARRAGIVPARRQ